jgi:hypothetical protein
LQLLAAAALTAVRGSAAAPEPFADAANA